MGPQPEAEDRAPAGEERPRHELASMGPQPEAEDRASRSVTVAGGDQLQWGLSQRLRIGSCYFFLVAGCVASMGPQPEAEDRFVGLNLVIVSDDASMGPQPEAEDRRTGKAAAISDEEASMGPQPEAEDRGGERPEDH